MSQVILIVEDEPKLASLLQDYLRQAGFDTATLDDGLAVESWIKHNHPALMILDLMLPGKDGIDICRDVRKFSSLPIIMATARVEEIDRLLGLELGADDYICKPYSPREVVARVKAILRRAAAPQAENAGFVIDAERYEIRLDGQTLDLTPGEFRLLQTFLTHPGQVYSRAQLLDHLHEDMRIVTDRTVDSHIKNLRKKLGAARTDLEGIQSVYGVGYKWVG
jgi:two-component system response regulator BaeR